MGSSEATPDAGSRHRRRLTAELLLAGPRGRRMLLELAQAPGRISDAAIASDPVRSAVFHAAHHLDPDPGTVLRAWPRGLRGRLQRAVARRGPVELPVVTAEQVASALRDAPPAPVDDAALVRAVEDAADAARPWQPPDGDDVLAGDPAVVAALRPLAERVAAAPGAAWWTAPVDRADQHHVVAVRGDEATPAVPDAGSAARLDRWRATVVEDVERAEAWRAANPGRGTGGAWWSFPWADLLGSSRLLPDGLPAGARWVEDGSGPDRLRVVPVEVPDDATVYEVDGARAWADLCRRFPLDVTAEMSDTWRGATGRRGRWVIPDWSAVAEAYDGVHLQVGGYLEAATTAIDLGDGRASVIAGWEPDTTFWLTDAARTRGPGTEWVRGEERDWVPAPAPGDGPVPRHLDGAHLTARVWPMTATATGAIPGDGTPGVRLVCVHGLGGSVENWHAFAERVRSWAEVVALDLPGFGRNRAHAGPPRGRRGGRRLRADPDPGSPPGTVAHAERLLERVLDDLGGDGVPTVLVGNSMGGLISLRVAARRTDLAGLVLVDATLPSARRFPSPLVAVAAGAYLVPGFGRALQGGRRRFSSPERAVEQVLRLTTAAPAAIGERVRADHLRLVQDRWDWPDQDLLYERAARTTVLAAARRRRLDADLAALTLPVLLLHGGHDRLVPVGGARRMAALRPEWDVRIAEELGHLPMMEDPDWTARAVQDWCGNVL